ncbi:hypothetical protein GE21DRAFT_5306 [Neurospora crassa]|uniref:Uncharacterized protein n=1 Tax=Neurospora crassa (strain ATCC 24698 / 74-OR23-1A / CBS 708.71 / DSM 1257 / FGSC 987) TaxID=367110 RepID=Q7S385_NEUCR|nr:hypothetical protein NCU04860 [Neurospora crassa OR74A]EAA29881.1 hypothetical protein NCU04860 [Neurospora crassa OR74A]KHE81885.1 hypothetical protein GE21DRAFT_5306 [Neurospora crassa]|eukprot:XP_959117.1 hypothetical protein NCU04860 [Neurospora crassa OR74A]
MVVGWWWAGGGCLVAWLVPTFPVVATPPEQPDAGADVKGIMLPLARARLTKKPTHYIRSTAPAYGIPVVRPCKIGPTAVTLVSRTPLPTWTARNRLPRFRGIESQTQSFAGHLTAPSPVPTNKRFAAVASTISPAASGPLSRTLRRKWRWKGQKASPSFSTITPAPPRRKSFRRPLGTTVLLPQISLPDDDSFAMKAIFYALAFPGQFMSTPNSVLVGRLTIMLIQIPPSVTSDLWQAVPRTPLHLPHATSNDGNRIGPLRLRSSWSRSRKSPSKSTLSTWGRSCRSSNYGNSYPGQQGNFRHQKKTTTMTSFLQNPLRAPRSSSPVTCRLRLPDGLHLKTLGIDPSSKEARVADSGEGRNSFLLLGVWDTAVTCPHRLAGGSAHPQAQLPDHRWTGVGVTASHSPVIGNGAKIVERPQGRDARGGGQERRVEVGGSRVKGCGIVE